MRKSGFNKMQKVFKGVVKRYCKKLHGRSPVNLLHIFRVYSYKNASGEMLPLH